MRERVNVILGKKPVLFVAPHGPDDTNTALIAEKAANLINGYAVINQGFERNDEVDVDNDLADCNRVDHCLSEVVMDEFLRPIIKIRNHSTKYGINPESDKSLLVIYVHGAGNLVHVEANEPVDVIIGYGLGKEKDSLTCKAWKKNFLVDSWRNISNTGEVYEGAGDGRYAGRSANNMNQYFRKHIMDKNVDSLQLEFPFSLRKTKEAAAYTASLLATTIDMLLNTSSYDKTPKSKFI